MPAIRTVLAIALAAALGLACAQLGVAPTARFKIDERFPDRIGEIKALGVEVKSALPDGSVSDADLEKLSAFFAVGLREAAFSAVINLNSGGNPDEVDLLLSIEINLLEAATPEEREKRVPSHLHGTLSLSDRPTGRNLGTATIWATGSGLDLEPNYMPNTVRAFTNALVEVIH